MRKLFVGLAILGMGAFANAKELDRENSRGHQRRGFKGTLILRVDTRTHHADYVKTDTVMRSRNGARAYVKSARFSRLPENRGRHELDRDGGSSSWYFYNGGYGGGGYGGGGYGGGYYNNPYCNYYGNTYAPYYSYASGYYNYYYYGNCYWGGGYGGGGYGGGGYGCGHYY